MMVYKSCLVKLMYAGLQKLLHRDWRAVFITRTYAQTHVCKMGIGGGGQAVQSIQSPNPPPSS